MREIIAALRALPRTGEIEREKPFQSILGGNILGLDEFLQGHDFWLARVARGAGVALPGGMVRPFSRTVTHVREPRCRVEDHGVAAWDFHEADGAHS